GPRQMRTRCRDSRRSISFKSYSFISSTRRRMRSISNTLPAVAFDSLISSVRGGCFGGGGGCLGGGGLGGFLPAGRRERDFSRSGSLVIGHLSLADNALHQLLRHSRQHVASILGHQHVVFDPHAAPARKINARLDGNHHARCEFL